MTLSCPCQTPPLSLSAPLFPLITVADVDPARRAALIELLDIDLSWRMHKVSDGQRRRVQIAMGLLRPFKVRLRAPRRNTCSRAVGFGLGVTPNRKTDRGQFKNYFSVTYMENQPCLRTGDLFRSISVAASRVAGFLRASTVSPLSFDQACDSR